MSVYTWVMRRFRGKLIVIALAAGAVLLPGGAMALAAQTAPAAAPAGLLWESVASQGPSVVQALEKFPGPLTAAHHPTGRFGPSFRYETWDNNGAKSRCESRGVSGVNLNSSQLGKTFY